MAKPVKPAPPSRDDVDADLVRQQLHRLGADGVVVRSADDRVYDALVKLWRGRKSKYPPTVNDVAVSAGLNGHTTGSTLHRLVMAGRVLRPRRGFYVPKVD